jgi:hypothetical protein
MVPSCGTDTRETQMEWQILPQTNNIGLREFGEWRLNVERKVESKTHYFLELPEELRCAVGERVS